MTLSAGIIGVGAFGVKVALRLLWNGFPTLQLYDVNDISTRQFTNDFGGQTQGSPRMMAQTADVIVTALPSARELREVCFGWENVTKGAALREPGAPSLTLVNLGIVDTLEAQAIARELKDRNVDFVDAPAYGTPAQAKDGQLTLVVGGEAGVVERARPLLDTLAVRVEHIGAAGAPQALGAISDYLRGAELLAACEAVRLGERFGLDPAYVSLVAESPGRTPLGELLRTEVLTRRFNSGRALGMLRGNIEHAATLAEKLGLVLPMLMATQAHWRMADDAIGSGADHTAVLRWLESLKAQTPAGGDDV